MAMAQISPNSVTANPARINPQVKTDQSATTAQANLTADQSIKKTKTDTVTISKQAAQMASQAQSSADRTTERQANNSKAYSSFAVKA